MVLFQGLDPLDDLGLPPPPDGQPSQPAAVPAPAEEPLELDRPAPPPTRTSNPNLQRAGSSNPNLPRASRAVVSASRLQPVPAPSGRISGAKLKEGAADVVLNGVSILGDVMEDFRRSDRFFKYKALVLGIWVLLSITSVMVACPGGPSQSNSFGARLVVAGTAKEPIYMVKNDSDKQWVNVEVVVNEHWHATADHIDANGEWVLSPVLLFDSTGHPADPALKVSDIDVKVGDDAVTVFKNGAPADR